MASKIFALLLLLAIPGAVTPQTGREFQSAFRVDKKTLGVKGSNPYFKLTPGYRLFYKNGDETDALTVLQETKFIDGVEVRIVEDRETNKGATIEVTRDYYAIDSVTNDVYYFGEDVDVHKNGKVVSHEGSWLSGVKGAKFGLMMPGSPKPGQRFFQEQAPGVGMDRAEIVSVDEKVSTPAGNFDRCVHVVETSLLEKDLNDHKWYAAGVGQVKDGSLPLVEYGSK
jgi:hypothetical protein